MYLSDKEAKALILSIGRKMYASGFVTANDGNLSVRTGDDAVWITPTGINKGDLTRDSLIKVDLAGRVLEGSAKPTSELQMHLNVYRTDDSIVSTAHAHPHYLTAFACAGIELDLPSTPSACCISGRVPVIPYCCSGSEELAQSVIPYVKKYHVVNLGNHGPFSWGKSPSEAWYRLEDAEASCKLALEILNLKRFRPLSGKQVEELLAFHHIDIEPEARVKLIDEPKSIPDIKFSDML